MQAAVAEVLLNSDLFDQVLQRAPASFRVVAASLSRHLVYLSQPLAEVEVLRRVTFVLERLVIDQLIIQDVHRSSRHVADWECISCDSTPETAGGGCLGCGSVLVPRSLPEADQDEYARHACGWYDGDFGADYLLPGDRGA